MLANSYGAVGAIDTRRPATAVRALQMQRQSSEQRVLAFLLGDE